MYNHDVFKILMDAYYYVKYQPYISPVVQKLVGVCKCENIPRIGCETSPPRARVKRTHYYALQRQETLKIEEEGWNPYLRDKTRKILISIRKTIYSISWSIFSPHWKFCSIHKFISMRSKKVTKVGVWLLYTKTANFYEHAVFMLY